jgi:uncharacterized protein (DUF2252 family)
MARSAHAYVRVNTEQFYQWLDSDMATHIPTGPPVWICGDCHVGNLGPLADREGRVRVQVRDLDQTVIGNPSHDLIRLGLSLALGSRSSNLPGVTTSYILEAMMDGYESAFARDFNESDDYPEQPDAVETVMKKASRRTWKHLAAERIGGSRLDIPKGKRFWPVSVEERQAIEALFSDPGGRHLATMIRSRADDATVEVLDAAYWMKGCSSLGLLRFAVLVRVTDEDSGDDDLCLMDIKEAVESAAPNAHQADMPSSPAERVVEGARHLSPFLGERMMATTLLERPVFVRELLPQDLKVELDRLTKSQAIKAAEFLAAVVGYAHARQMEPVTRRAWRDELGRNRPGDLDAPSWLWQSVADLLVNHERTYFDHCRVFAHERDAGS